MLIPFATAAGIAGLVNAPVAWLLVSVVSFYLARTSFLKGDYRWMVGLFAGSFIAAVPVVFVWHRWWLIAFGVVVAPVAFRKTDRSVALQLAAVAGLTLTAPVAWYVATGSLGWPAWRLWLVNAFYFAGRVFYVKMHVAAAVQRNASRLRLGASTLAYHGALAGVAVCWWPVGLAFVPGVVHAFIGVAQLTPVLRIKRLAWTEVAVSVMFGLSLVTVTRWCR